jgi:hypothetical protein
MYQCTAADCIVENQVRAVVIGHLKRHNPNNPKPYTPRHSDKFVSVRPVPLKVEKVSSDEEDHEEVNTPRPTFKYKCRYVDCQKKFNNKSEFASHNASHAVLNTCRKGSKNSSSIIKNK